MLILKYPQVIDLEKKLKDEKNLTAKRWKIDTLNIQTKPNQANTEK